MSIGILRRGSIAASMAAGGGGGGTPPVFGALLPPRLAQSGGSVTNVSTQAQLESALGSVPNGSIINITANINGGGSQLNVSRVASAAGPITITSNPGVLITNFSQIYTTGQYLRYKNLNVGFNALAGIKFDGTANHNEIVGCTIHHTGRMGILVYCTTYPDDIQVWDNTVYLNGSTSNGALDHGMYWGTGVKSAGSAYGSVVANNLFYDNCAFNTQLYPNISGLIYVCNVNDGGMLHANQRGGLIIGSESGQANDNILVGNIGTNAPNNGAIQPYQTTSHGNIGYDNLGFGNSATDFQTNAIISYANCIHGDPLYVDRAAKNYHLRAGSPAIGLIQPARYGFVPPLDKDGNPRITADAGCYRA